MARLQKWMDKHSETDATLAAKLGISRVQVSRIRRGKNGASVATAKRLEVITQIPWPTFVDVARERAA